MSMTNQTIPAEAVEAARDTLSSRWYYHASPEEWQEIMRAALEAAAPYLRAEGWDAYESAPYEIRLNEDGEKWEPVKDNPYRPTV